MAQMTQEIQEKIIALLLDEGLVEQAEIDRAAAEAERSGTTLMAYVVAHDVVNNETLTHALAYVVGTPYINLLDTVISQDILALLPLDIAERFMAVPLATVQNRLAVAMIDASNIQAVDYLSNRIQRPLKVFMASEAGVKHVLDQYKTDLSTVGDAAQASVDDEAAAKQNSDIVTLVQDSPISRALNTIIEYAVKTHASDIHIEPLEKELKIRCRIDGMLREVMTLPKSIEPPLVSRIKILSNLKIDEHRIPQDGQFTVAIANKEIDLRIAISPVVWGEQVAIRLLDKSGADFSLETMGYAGRSLKILKKGISRSSGMILTSGPTGSGKSTSLYALIKEIKNDTINIITLEDPVEYKMEGVNQIQVNNEVGLTFGSGLRSILRLDPDVIMVGEIRDAETANLAVQAALTGHLVFSTLHTNSAAGVLPRLLDMGIEPFLIASTVNTIIGQRLVRRISKRREIYQSDELETASIRENIGHLLPKDMATMPRVAEYFGYNELPLATQESFSLAKGKITTVAPHGYEGRAGLYEVMDVTEEIQSLIVKQSTSSEIQKLAIQQGMITMRQDGYMKALQGVTTIDEVNRVAANMA